MRAGDNEPSLQWPLVVRNSDHWERALRQPRSPASLCTRRLPSQVDRWSRRGTNFTSPVLARSGMDAGGPTKAVLFFATPRSSYWSNGNLCCEKRGRARLESQRQSVKVEEVSGVLGVLPSLISLSCCCRDGFPRCRHSALKHARCRSAAEGHRSRSSSSRSIDKCDALLSAHFAAFLPCPPRIRRRSRLRNGTKGTSEARAAA